MPKVKYIVKKIFIVIAIMKIYIGFQSVPTTIFVAYSIKLLYKKLKIFNKMIMPLFVKPAGFASSFKSLNCMYKQKFFHVLFL